MLARTFGFLIGNDLQLCLYSCLVSCLLLFFVHLHKLFVCHLLVSSSNTQGARNKSRLGSAREIVLGHLSPQPDWHCLRHFGRMYCCCRSSCFWWGPSLVVFCIRLFLLCFVCICGHIPFQVSQGRNIYVSTGRSLLEVNSWQEALSAVWRVWS